MNKIRIEWKMWALLAQKELVGIWQQKKILGYLGLNDFSNFSKFATWFYSLS